MSETETPRDAKAELKAAKAYAKATRPWYKKKRFWLLGIIALIVIFALASGGDDETATDGAGTTSSQGTAESSEAPAEEPAEEPALVVTAQKLIEDLEENALAASQTYKGKRVTVTGTLSNIDASGDYFTLKGTDEFSLTNVQVFIEDDLVETVSGFKADQEVTVTGEITDVGELLGYSIQAETIG